jgi:predicted aminopeptidase
MIASLCGCSPIYVAKVATGHAGLLWRRKSIEKALKDPKTPPELKAKLEVAAAARAYAFDAVGLKRSREYSTYSPVKGPYLTYLVEACAKLSFTPFLWHFPIAGTFPYKGHFNPKDAEAEAEELKAKGFDTYIGGVAAYNTPLWFSDPVPSTVLSGPTGEIADLLIHELTHSTVFYKNQIDFNESLATFVGREGAKEFLAKRYGPDSAELKAYLKSQDDEARFGARMDALYASLDEVYKSSATDAEKLRRREEIFTAALKDFYKEDFTLKSLNNAVVLAHRVYHRDLDVFATAFASQGRNWPKTIALFKSLDPKDPLADLKRKVLVSSAR